MRSGSRWGSSGLLLLAALASGCGADFPISIAGPPEFKGSDYSPAWSPDGLQIAYYHQPGFHESTSGDAIWLMDTSGVATHPVLFGAAGPDWSPDGTHLAISRYGGLYSVKPTGDSLRAITTMTGSMPHWSPSGSELAFESYDTTYAASIWLVSLDGTGLRSLGPTGIESWSAPDWSPDGTHLVHCRKVSTSSPGEIYVMDATGHGEQRLTTDGYDDWAPAWSPDGLWIAWTSARQGRNELWLMKPDGTGAHTVTPGFSPSWSPDSRQIVFSRLQPDNTLRLFTIDLATSRIRQLTR